MLDYRKVVNERHTLLRLMRNKTVKIILSADPIKLRTRYTALQPDSTLSANRLVTVARREQIRASLLLNVMTRFVVVANTTEERTVQERTALLRYLPNEIKRLRMLDSVYIPSAR